MYTLRFTGIVMALLLAGCAGYDGTTPDTTAPPASSDASSAAVSSDPSPAGPSSEPAVTDGTNTTGLPLTVPQGFSVEILARGLSGVRAIIKDGMGNFWVSQPGQGTVAVLEMRGDAVTRANPVFRNLNKPHGLAVADNGMTLYIAEETRIIKARLYSDANVETIATLPAGGRHTTRALGFGPDGRLSVSIGSTCDACVEKNEEHGTIISMNTDGSDRKIIARGLRNAVFFTKHSGTGDLWATEMGRDFKGDDIPPEEVNIIRDGAHYGWPYCYGDRVRDQSFQLYEDFDCSATVAPHATLPAHIAPLGLAFIPDSWPAEYRGDLLVAEHGSWDSSVKVGYKVVRIPLTANGAAEGPAQDFLSGFLQPGQRVIGRPVDMVFDDERLLITDDQTGSVYRISPPGA